MIALACIWPSITQAIWPIREKTLVAWVSPDTLQQAGGSVLTLEKPGGIFDGIVFGELSPATWMAGSDFYHRTNQDQKDSPKETTTDGALVEVAITYRVNEISIYRAGRLISTYKIASEESFGDDSETIIGLRHLEAQGNNRLFSGSIADARIYPAALTPTEIAGLKPYQIEGRKPLAWWNFRDGVATDRMNTYPVTTLVGDARIQGDRLVLGRQGGYLLSRRTAPDAMSDPNALTRQLREKLLSDPLRPGYHFVNPEGVAMPFDPDGGIYWKGQYHLFYIYQDDRGHNWGHVSSTDLFHWRFHPTGLKDGMFSGNCFLNKDGVPTICYHQVGLGDSMAVAQDDDLDTWKKLPSNPITPKTSPDPAYRSWDPFAWVEADHYYAIFGGQHPAVVKSPSLEGPWTYVGNLMANSVPGVAIDEDVSCANLYKLGKKYVLVCISHRLGCRYYVGDWKNESFHPQSHAMMSWIDHSFFAPRCFKDDKGRLILWNWLLDYPGFGTRTDFGWSGTMSLPRVLTLAPDNTLRMNPPEEIAQLRYLPQSLSNLQIGADSVQDLPKMFGNSFEMDLTMNGPQAAAYGVSVCRSPDGSEETRVFYDAKEKRLKVDTTKSGLGAGAKVVESAPFELQPGEPLKLRVFVDKSVVEVFANDGRQAIARRIYPTRNDSIGVRLFSRGGKCSIPMLQFWRMMASNPY